MRLSILGTSQQIKEFLAPAFATRETTENTPSPQAEASDIVNTLHIACDEIENESQESLAKAIKIIKEAITQIRVLNKLP